MGELIDIGTARTYIRRDQEKDPARFGVTVHPMIIAEVDRHDLDGENDTSDIVEQYQQSILDGVSAREALVHALVALRQIR